MPIDMHALARLGAQTRIAELVEEIDALLEAFPDLGQEPARPVAAAATDKNLSKPRRPTASASASAQTDAAPATRTRKPMSAAAKKAVGERMKAYWAKRKGTASVAVTEPATTSAVEEPVAKLTAKRTLSAEGRAKISAAAKKRWKAQRKAKKAA
jgi:hypothetical protein